MTRWWPWSRNQGIDPVQLHTALPTVPDPEPYYGALARKRHMLRTGEGLRSGANVKVIGPAPKPRMILEEDQWVRPIEVLEDYGPIG